MSELGRLEFLIGSWKGSTKDQFGQEGTLETTLDCKHEPSEKFVQLTGESRLEGRILNRGIEFIAIDTKKRKYIYKRFWSYGFIENGEGDWEDDDTLVFEIKYDNEPEYFSGTHWRSFIRRYGQNKIGTGLFSAKEGQPYKLYGETRLTRTKD